MNQQQSRSQLQVPLQLTCTKHQEAIKGVCLHNGSCNERLLCRLCRKGHDNNHLNSYEEFDDLLNGNLVNDVLKEFDGMLKRIDNQNQASTQNIQNLIGEIDGLFNNIQNYLTQKLNQARNLILDDINKKFKKDGTLKQKITNIMEEVHKTYNMAANSGFKPIYVIENLIQVLRQAHGQKDRIENDPEMNSQQASDMSSDYLFGVTNGSYFQHARFTFDKTIQEITENLLSRGYPKQVIPIPEPFQQDSNLLFNEFGQIGQEISRGLKQTQSDMMTLEGGQTNLFSDLNPPSLNFSFLNSFGSYPGSIHKAQYQRDSSNVGPQLQLNSFESRIIPPDVASAQDQLGLKVPNNSINLGANFPILNQTSQAKELMDALARGPIDMGMGDSMGMQSSLPNLLNQRLVPEDQPVQNFLQDQPNMAQPFKTGFSSVPKSDILPQGGDSRIGRPSNRDETSFDSMQVENETKKKASMSPRRKQTPVTILEIFKKVNEDRKQDAPQEMSESKKIYDPLSALNSSRNHDSGKASKRPDDRRKGEILEQHGNILTQHKQILYGGMAYISSRFQLATAGREGKIQIWDVSKRQNVHSFMAHNSEIFKLLYIEDKDALVSSSADGTVCVWDCRNQFQLVVTYRKHEGPVYALEYLPDVNMIASGGEDGNLRLWNMETMKEIPLMKFPDAKIGSICYLKKLKKLAVGFEKGNINVVNVNIQSRKMTPAFSLKAHTGYVLNIAWVEDSSYLITASDDGLIKIWKIFAEGGDCIRECGLKGKVVRSFVTIYEKDLLISNHDDNYLRLWKISTGDMIMEQYDKTFGECILGIRNRNKIMTGNHNEVKLWNLNY